jgi:hypothetical protein
MRYGCNADYEKAGKAALKAIKEDAAKASRMFLTARVTGDIYDQWSEMSRNHI